MPVQLGPTRDLTQTEIGTEPIWELRGHGLDPSLPQGMARHLRVVRDHHSNEHTSS
jgi:hypothetical protein